ncbi:hypothetical protein C8R43DRAFT_432885 [Mycena crocata]|nr:hypothetical protein C8R43DRAFT_432885 [Mycena crocata]
MFPGYSPFICSGWLAPPSSSPRFDDEFDLGPRRGSLPTDSPPSYVSSTDEASMFYFTLQPRRDKDHFRSFLSLDLAESQSLRSHSLRRKHSNRRQSREPPFAVDFQIPDSPCLPSPSSPIGLRKSPTNSLRALPSPKPAPVAVLPSVPSTPRSQTLQVRVSRTPTPVAVRTAPQRKPSMASQATRASATTSTVSTRYRRTRRNKALDCLEGRRPALRPASNGNFMSLSDDEDEDDDEDEPVPRSPSPEDDILDLSLSDDQLIMLIAGLDDGDLHSIPPSSPRPSKASSRDSSTRTASTQPRRRRKTSRALKSFMDFHNDDDSSRWSWRSFIEVAT